MIATPAMVVGCGGQCRTWPRSIFTGFLSPRQPAGSARNARHTVASPTPNSEARDARSPLTQQQALVGTSTTLDVLIQNQQLLTTQSQLVTAQHDAALAEFNLAAAVGRLIAPEPPGEAL
jgi:hypothetical protein